jgi:hypothetical protein
MIRANARHGIHPTMIAADKRQATDGMAGAFSGTSKAAKATGDCEIETLEAKSGRLVVKRHVLSKAFARCTWRTHGR